MKKLLLPVVVIGVVLIAGGSYFHFRSAKPAPVDSSLRKVRNFTALDHEGVSQTLYRFVDEKAIVIISQDNGCEKLPGLISVLRKVQREYSSRGIRFFMINSNPENDRQSIINKAAEYGLRIPILLDPAQIVTGELSLRQTTETVVIIPKTWQIVYRGPIDESLRKTLAAIDSGRIEGQTDQLVQGTPLSLREKKRVSLKDEAAPLIAKKCLDCHTVSARPHFKTYEDLKENAAQIRESILTDTMPPFSIDSFYSSDVNELTLSEEEKKILIDWIDQGANNDGFGDPIVKWRKAINDEQHTEVTKAVKKMRRIYTGNTGAPVEVSGEGDTEFRYFQIGGPVPRDLWITAVHVQPSKRPLLQKASLIVASKPLTFFEDLASEIEYDNKCYDSSHYLLGAFMGIEHRENKQFRRFSVWGKQHQQPYKVSRTPLKLVTLVPKGHYLILETLNRGLGRPAFIRTKLDFYSDVQKVDRSKYRVVRGRMMNTPMLAIPPGSKSHFEHTRFYKINTGISLLSVIVHMHYRGRSAKVVQKDREGNVKTIFSIPNFNYGQTPYMEMIFSTPIDIPKGDMIGAICEFDNSSLNTRIHDTQTTVRHGISLGQSEMCNVHLTYAAQDENAEVWGVE